MGLFKRMQDPVRGTAQVASCNMPRSGSMYFNGDFELVVSAEGVPATPVHFKSHWVPVKRWPMPGQTLPITLDRANPERIEIHWKEVPSGQQQAERNRQAQQLAAQMKAQRGAAGQGTPNVSGAPAELGQDQAARVQQALGSLGVGGLGSAQVIDVRGQGGAGAAAPDPVDQLQKLDQLRQSGALTDAEFEQQKQRILSEQ